MASIEKRQGKRGTCHRIAWWNRGKQGAKCPRREAYDHYAKIIEHVECDQAAADRALMGATFAVSMLSEIAETHIARLIDAAPYTRTKYRQAIRTHIGWLDRPVDQITDDNIVR